MDDGNNTINIDFLFIVLKPDTDADTVRARNSPNEVCFFLQWLVFIASIREYLESVYCCANTSRGPQDFFLSSYQEIFLSQNLGTCIKNVYMNDKISSLTEVEQ